MIGDLEEDIDQAQTNIDLVTEKTKDLIKKSGEDSVISLPTLRFLTSCWNFFFRWPKVVFADRRSRLDSSHPRLSCHLFMTSRLFTMCFEFAFLTRIICPRGIRLDVVNRNGYTSG